MMINIFNPPCDNVLFLMKFKPQTLLDGGAIYLLRSRNFLLIKLIWLFHHSNFNCHLFTESFETAMHGEKIDLYIWV